MKNCVFTGLIFLATSLAAISTTEAQVNRARTSLTGGLQTSIPLGGFSDQYSDTPVGLGASFTTPLMRRSPLHAGFGFGWNRIDRDEQEIYVPYEGESLAKADYEVTTNRYTYDLHLRLSPLNGRFQPFVEGAAGWSNYITRSDLKTDFPNGHILEQTERMHNDMSWNYGWGVGMHLRLAPMVFLEAKVQRLYASETSFINHETLMINETGGMEYEMIEARPEFLTIQAGLTFKF